MSLEEKIEEAVIEWEEEELKNICKSAIEKKIKTPADLLQTIGNVMSTIGDQFEKEGFIKKDLKSLHKGRAITAKGKKFLDDIAAKISKIIVEKPKEQKKEIKEKEEPKKEEKKTEQKETKQKEKPVEKTKETKPTKTDKETPKK